jgi:hypothetical protein
MPGAADVCAGLLTRAPTRRIGHALARAASAGVGRKREATR